MKRRELITLLGGAAVAWPCAAIAQTPAKVYRIGLLSAGGPVADASPFGAPLIRGLAQQGYALGRNLTFERRGAEGQLDRLPRLFDELAASKVDVIITLGYPPALVAKQKGTLPVVAFSAGDPVSTGLVESLARPGGNITGISDVSGELTPKRMELLKQMAPALKRVAMLWNVADLGMTVRYRASETGAKALGISVQPLGVREPDDFELAFAAMKREMPDAIFDGVRLAHHAQPQARFRVRRVASPAGDLRVRLRRPRRRLDVLRPGARRELRARCVSRRSHSQRREARGPAVRAADALQARHQPEDREGDRA